MGITWYPPLGAHIAFTGKRPVLLGFTSARLLVGSKLLPKIIVRTMSIKKNTHVVHLLVEVRGGQIS